jgi:hypothetical protein
MNKEEKKYKVRVVVYDIQNNRATDFITKSDDMDLVAVQAQQGIYNFLSKWQAERNNQEVKG